MHADKLNQIGLFHKLPEESQTWLRQVSEKWPFSFQQLKMLTEYSADMLCWNAGSPEQFYNPEKIGAAVGKQAAALVFRQIRDGHTGLVNKPKDYSTVNSAGNTEAIVAAGNITETELVGNIMGTCPVASDKTRCCNLRTMDAVQQCGFGCSYCSIQSFYHGNQIRFIRDLIQHLDGLQLDPQQTYHIGTGQSSDSLMWGNHLGLLDNLYDFARRNPNVILEMKSKSGRIDYLLQHRPPANMIFTWSLNPQKVVEHEEKGSAPLHKRLQCARQLADMGCPVGFHLHPMVWYEGYQQDYQQLIEELTGMFRPEEVVMVSLGTLTFIKSVIRRIRENLLQSTILQMPMEEIGGKYSYPFAIKKEMFGSAYKAFPSAWRKEVFFYMCMEDIRLWQPVFGRSYESNEEFEQDMLNSYTEKLQSLHKKSTAAAVDPLSRG